MASTTAFGAIATIRFTAMGFAAMGFTAMGFTAAALAAAMSRMAAIFGSRSPMPIAFAVACGVVVVDVVVTKRSAITFKHYLSNRLFEIFILFGLGVAAPFKSNRAAGFSWLPWFPAF
jgi:hypothetical protein